MLREKTKKYSVHLQVPDDVKPILDYLSGIGNTQKFSEEIRKFALTLRFYSPRAYDYVRDKFHKNLPHPTTIKKWYQQSNIQTKSGICTRSFELIKDKANELKEEGKELYVGLIFDEMHIREHLQWMKNKKFSGFITFGKVSEECETLPLATQVLVFLLSGINTSFHIPIAYYFVERLEAIDKLVLITSIIKMLNSAGVKLLTITCDGHPTNISVNEMLGCSYNLNDLQPYFKNPENESPIYSFFDPPHMLKLIRNALGSRKQFYDRFGRPIKWEYFVKLVNLCDTDSMISHKMTKAHINYEQKNKMNVSLAAQTFSQSVGKSLKSLADRKYPGFENAFATAEFSLRIDQTFDILNSGAQISDNIFKIPLNEQIFADICSFIDDTIDYLQKLTIEPHGKPIVTTEIKVGFKGMIIGLKNVKLIYTNVVQKKFLQQFPVQSICQCSLESLFSRCRSCSMLGFNTNPNVSQFESIMRKVVVNNEITGSAFANCTDRLDILYVSSHVPKKLQNLLPHSSRDAVANDGILSDLNDCNIIPISENRDQISDDNNRLYIDSPSNTAIGIAYISSEIDKRIQCNGVLKCYLCSLVITENEKLSIDSFPATKSMKIPCRSTYEICTIAHHILEPRILKSTFEFNETFSIIISEIHPESLFSNTDFSSHSSSDHKDSLIVYIVENYISIYASQIARKISLDCQFKRIESKKDKQNQKEKKLAHFKGR